MTGKHFYWVWWNIITEPLLFGAGYVNPHHYLHLGFVSFYWEKYGDWPTSNAWHNRVLADHAEEEAARDE